jgi:hypothetical protein
MNTETFEPTSSSEALLPGPPMVVAYEDSETFQRVSRELRNLFGCQLADVSRSVAWKFDLLEHTALFQQALEDAIAADLIIVTVHGYAPLPNGVKAWVEQWRNQTTADTGLLVVLLDASSRETPEAIEALHYLRTAAQDARFGWYAVFCEPPGSAAAAFSSHARPKRTIQ